MYKNFLKEFLDHFQSPPLTEFPFQTTNKTYLPGFSGLSLGWAQEVIAPL
jgi:hypothetical protein